VPLEGADATKLHETDEAAAETRAALDPEAGDVATPDQLLRSLLHSGAGELLADEDRDTPVIEVPVSRGTHEPLLDNEIGETPAETTADSTEPPFTPPRSQDAKSDAPRSAAPENADEPREARFESDRPSEPGWSNPWRRVTLPPRYSFDPTRLSPLAEAVWAPMSNADFRGIDDWIQTWKEAGNERERDAAAREFWTRVATVVARRITDENHRLAIRQGLYEYIGSWYTDQAPSTRQEKERRVLGVSFLNLLRQQGIEVLKELAMYSLIELIFPGIHFVLPPTGFVSAIFSACDLLAIFPPA